MGLLLAHGAGATPPPCAPPPAVAADAVDANAPTDPSAAVAVSSAGAEADVTDGGKTHLTGPVTVTQGNRRLNAANATYDSGSETFDVLGQVVYQDPRMKLSGDAATWRTAGSGEFSHADFELAARQARGHADAISLAPDGRLELNQVSYTACPANRQDWLLRAARIDIDQKAQAGLARDVRLEFLGVPLFYLPVVSFPVSDARKTGFLFPDFGSSIRNAIEAPFYLNLAPNYDATLTPGIIATRGLSLGSEFRFLTDDSRGSLRDAWVPHDASADRDRNFVRFDDVTDLNGRLRFDTNIAYVSDSAYFEDFGQGTEGTSVIYLPRLARMTYLDTNWRATALVEQYQVIDTSIAAVDRPYTRAPDITVDGRWSEAAGAGFAVRGEAVTFSRDTGVQGSRFDLEPTASWSFRGPGSFLVPSLGWHALAYSLRDNPGGSNSPNVNAPVATLDGGLTFERAAGANLQTLEPRLLYTYIPYRQQDALPSFDTTLPDLNLVELFRPQRYVGGDRIGDANQVAFGTTSRFIDLASGRQLVAVTLGDIYYFTPPRVQLPNQPVADGRTSDVVSQIDLTAYDHWNVSIGEEWDPHAQRSDITEVRVQYQPDHDRVVNLGYSYRHQLLDQVEASTAWPVARSWNIYAKQVYSLRDHAPIESLAGFEYGACCWRIRVLGRRYVSSFTGSRNSGISIQLELNGLSSVGQQDGAFLERAIRGYSATAPDFGPE